MLFPFDLCNNSDPDDPPPPPKDETEEIDPDWNRKSENDPIDIR